MSTEKPSGMKGIFKQLSSKHDPVFGNKPLVITFVDLPRVNDSFKFLNNHFGVCYTSSLQHLSFEAGAFVLVTMNSVYTLEMI